MIPIMPICMPTNSNVLVRTRRNSSFPPAISPQWNRLTFPAPFPARGSRPNNVYRRAL